MNSAQLAKVDHLRAQLERGVIAATPVPFSADGKVHEAAAASYMRYIAAQPLAGVAVWAHTGRGLKIDDETAENVLSGWRTNLAGKLLIAALARAKTSRRGSYGANGRNGRNCCPPGRGRTAGLSANLVA